jgi:hypothetical protein
MDLYTMRNFVTFTIPQIFLVTLNKARFMGGACSTYWGLGNSYKILVGKYKRETLLSSPGRRCQDNIKTNLKKIV